MPALFANPKSLTVFDNTSLRNYQDVYVFTHSLFIFLQIRNETQDTWIFRRIPGRLLSSSSLNFLANICEYAQSVSPRSTRQSPETAEETKRSESSTIIADGFMSLLGMRRPTPELIEEEPARKRLSPVRVVRFQPTDYPIYVRGIECICCRTVLTFCLRVWWGHDNLRLVTQERVLILPRMMLSKAFAFYARTKIFHKDNFLLLPNNIYSFLLLRDLE